MSIKPSSGVIYKPDANSDIRIEGDPYKKEQREFQKKIAQSFGKRQATFPKSVRLSDQKKIISKNSKTNMDAEQYLDQSLEFGKSSKYNSSQQVNSETRMSLKRMILNLMSQTEQIVFLVQNIVC